MENQVNEVQTTLDEPAETRRDMLENAFNEVESTTEDSRPRDEQGKFAPKEPQTAAPEAPVTREENPVAAAPTKPRPSSWKKDYEEKWGKLDPEIQDYILKRESDYAGGVSTYRQEAERAKVLNDAIAPFIEDLERHQINPASWISNLGNAHRTLAMGSPEQKQQMFVKLASDYGVNLGALTGAQQDPQAQYLIDQLKQQLSQVSSEWNQFKTTQQQHEEQTIRQACDSFAADTEKHPHFDEVRETMAQLLEAGIAQDLETAYQKSVRMIDGVWEKEQARQQQASEAQRQQAAEKARAHAVSPKTATPSRAVPNGKKDRVSLLSEAFDSLDARL